MSISLSTSPFTENIDDDPFTLSPDNAFYFPLLLDFRPEHFRQTLSNSEKLEFVQQVITELNRYLQDDQVRKKDLEKDPFSREVDRFALLRDNEIRDINAKIYSLKQFQLKLSDKNR